MKQLIIAATMLAAQLSMAAIPVHRAEQVSIENVVLDPQLEGVYGDVSLIRTADLKIDYAREVVTLTLHREFYCPVGTFCPAVMPMPEIVELPIVNITNDRCGNRVIMSERRAIGSEEYQSIVITDSRDVAASFRCPKSPTGETKIVYSYVYVTVKQGVVHHIPTASYLEAGALQAIPAR